MIKLIKIIYFIFFSFYFLFFPTVNAQEKIKIPEKFGNFLNTLSYNMSWSETNNEGSLLQHNYDKETFNFGLTKRIYY